MVLTGNVTKEGVFRNEIGGTIFIQAIRKDWPDTSADAEQVKADFRCEISLWETLRSIVKAFVSGQTPEQVEQVYHCRPMVLQDLGF